jgi:hypothetical protein
MEFSPYKNMVQLVEQATKAKFQVQEDLKNHRTKSFFTARYASNASASTKPTFYSSSKLTMK